MENVSLIDNTDSQLIVGDEDNNNLIGTIEDNIIKGLEGDDTLNGNAGNDSLNGGSGDNTLYGGVGDDTLVTNFGYVDGESGNDTLIANYSNYEDSISNIAWRSRIKNSDNDNLISLYSIENYQIIGTAFNDSLQGSGNDSLDGGEGVDKLNLNFSIETEPIIIDFTTVDNQVTFENTEVKNFEEIGSIYGGSNDDIITLGLAASTSGGYVYGLHGNDTLVLDYSGYETAIENIDWSSRVQRIDNNVNLIYYDDIQQYQITGTEFDDSLQGGSNSDTLIGGSGDDEIYGNGNDSLDGGEGTDKLNLDFSIETEPILIDLSTTDHQVDFENTEVKNFEEIGSIYGGSNDDIITLGLAASTSGGYVYGLHGNDTLVLDYSGYETAIENIDWSSRVQRIDNNVNLIYYYDIKQYQITGTEFDDSLQGGSNSDTLIGGSGNDEIYGNGNDILDGGEGTDKLSLDFSIETEPILIDLSTTDNQVDFENTEVKNFEEIGSIYGGSNDDIITLGLAASISGGYVYGLHGNDTLILDYSGYETAIENIDWSSRVKRIDNDVELIYYDDIQQYQITGTEYNDSLQGGSNSDTLIGGSGDDSLVGNSGEDILTGVNPNLENAGVSEIDTLVGGADSDYFLLGDANQTFYDDGESSSQGREDYALIKDFDLTEDKIELLGSKDNYRLGFSPITDLTGTAVYRVGDGYEADELIAIIEDVTELNLNSDVFSSIANSIDDDATDDTDEEEVEVIDEPNDIEEEVEIIPEPDDVEEEVEIITEPDDIKISRLDSYQISRLVVGLSMDVDDFTEIELNTLADINRDGIISAFDAYLAYSTFDEV